MSGRRVKADWRDYLKSDTVVRHRGADEIVTARMTGVGLQPKTVGALKMRATIVEPKAIVVGKDGKTRVERSNEMALFNQSACAVMRLWRDGHISDDGAVWAVKVAWAGDRVYGAVRVKTARMDQEVIGPSVDGLEPSERDTLAREVWDRASAALGRRLFSILDRVMRHDASAVEAARAVFVGVSDRKKLSGMGDASLIEACERLVATFVRGPKSSESGGLRDL